MQNTRSSTRLTCGLLLLACLHSGIARGQQPIRTIRVGLFVPLFLDSVFNEDGAYRYGNGFPKQSISGLDFYQGVSYALDTLQKNGLADIDVRVFDIRSRDGNLSMITRQPLMDSLNLIIGQVSGSDYLKLAEVSRARRIPFISATYPNDGGIRNHPYLIMSSARLQTHLQLLQSYLSESISPGRKPIWLRRTNPQDDRLAAAFQESRSPETTVGYQTVSLPDTFTDKHIIQYLDSTRNNVIIAGSLDEGFALRLLNQCLILKKSYPITVIGMPTWEAIAQIRNARYKTIPIEHTASFHRPAISTWGDVMETEYRKRAYSRPSDVTFKAYQAAFHFISLLIKYDTLWAANLNDPGIQAYSSYDFKPVYISNTSSTPDYYENKRIYLIRREGGSISLVR